MATFQIDKLKEVYGKIDGLKSRLQTEANHSCEYLTGITDNLSGVNGVDNLKQIIDNYNEGAVAVCNKIIANLDQMKTYLNSKINEASTSNTTTGSGLDAVTSSLDNINL